LPINEEIKIKINKRLNSKALVAIIVVLFLIISSSVVSANKYTSWETSPEAPALCIHDGTLYIAWTGNNNKMLNVAKVDIKEGEIEDEITGFSDKVTLSDTSPTSPSIASIGNRLFIAWKGNGNDYLNIMYSTDGGKTFGNKYTSRETSPEAPALCAHDGSLYIAWTGNNNKMLNVAKVDIKGDEIIGFSNKVTLGETSPVSPALASINNYLYIAWKGNGNDYLNVMCSNDGGRTFGNKYTSRKTRYTSQETSPKAPALGKVHYLGKAGSTPIIAWTGNGNNQLNVAEVHIFTDTFDENGNSFALGIIGKKTFDDTSPASPALASIGEIMFIAWKGNGNDYLNVMTYGEKNTGDRYPF